MFRKPTDIGRCLNGSSYCPDRYKKSVVLAYVNRAIKHCSSWMLINAELRRVRQMLINNRYSIRLVDRCIHDAIKKQVESDSQVHRTQHAMLNRTESGTTYKLYYKNNMSQAYKADERALRAIVRRHCKPVSAGDQLKLIVFYRNPTTRSLLMINNPTAEKSLLKQSNIIYCYKCVIGDCALRNNCKYIGHTTTTLSRRITMHLQNGGPKTHTNLHHDQRLTRKQMLENTSIIDRTNNTRELHVLEAIHIRNQDPTINRQVNARGTLVLYEGARLGHRM